MKKFLLIMSILLLPVSAFADFQIGPTIQYKTPISSAATIPGKDRLSINDFSLGADVRANIGLFQITGYGLLNPGDPTFSQPTTVKLYTDAGVCVTFLIFRLGLGAGPNFIFHFGNSNTTPLVNCNIRAAADVMIGNIAVSLVYLIEANLSPAGVAHAFEKINGQLGLSVLFKVF
jgi:hypothetical protein